MADTQTSEWIPHDGTGMPVDGETKVAVKFRDGEVFDPPLEAHFWHNEADHYSNWHFGNERGQAQDDADIIAYRVVKP